MRKLLSTVRLGLSGEVLFEGRPTDYIGHILYLLLIGSENAGLENIFI